MLMLCEFKDQTLNIHLQKPKEKGKVIARIISMPKSADHKYPQLTGSFTFEWWPLIYRFSEPLLNRHIPICNFLPYMHIRLNLGHIYRVYLVEFIVLNGVTDTTWLYRANWQFPSEIVFETEHSYSKPSVKYNIDRSLLWKLQAFHIVYWEE